MHVPTTLGDIYICSLASFCQYGHSQKTATEGSLTARYEKRHTVVASPVVQPAYK